MNLRIHHLRLIYISGKYLKEWRRSGEVMGKEWRRSGGGQCQPPTHHSPGTPTFWSHQSETFERSVWLAFKKKLLSLSESLSHSVLGRSDIENRLLIPYHNYDEVFIGIKFLRHCFMWFYVVRCG